MSVVQHILSVYKLWFSFFIHIPKTSRYTLGLKIDELFVDIVECVTSATYSIKERKPLLIEKAIAKLDVLNFFLQIAWEIKALDERKYILLSEPLNNIGKMLGGWLRQSSREKPST